MGDDCVPASPNRLSVSVTDLITRRVKRRCRREAENQNKSRLPGSHALDITSLYFPECEARDSVLQPAGLFTDVLKLETKKKCIQQTKKVSPTLSTHEFAGLSAFIHEPKEDPSLATVDNNFVSDSELLHVCKVVDAAFGQQLNIKPVPTVRVDTDNEFSSMSSFSASQNQAHISQVAGISHGPQRRDNEKVKGVRKRIIFPDDSDKKCSSVSDTLLNDGPQIAHADDVYLDKSLDVHENMRHLGSFFSQSFSEDDAYSLTNDIFRYIMYWKNSPKKKRVLTIEGENTSSFEGFTSSETSEGICNDGKLDNVGNEMLGKISDGILESNIAEDISRKAFNDVAKAINIDALLHDEILPTVKIDKFSENSIVDSVEAKWIMRPSVHNSITASDIEIDSEPKNDIFELNRTYTITNAPTSSKLINEDEAPDFPEMLRRSKECDFDSSSTVASKFDSGVFNKTCSALLNTKCFDRDHLCFESTSRQAPEIIQQKKVEAECLMKVNVFNQFEILPKISNNCMVRGESNIHFNESLGFQSASGKMISVSKAAQKNALQMMLETERMNDVYSNSLVSVNVKQPAKDGNARTVFNKNISLYARELTNEKNKIKKNAKDDEKYSNSFTDLRFVEANFGCGFQTASGSTIDVSKAASLKAETMMANINDFTLDGSSLKFDEASARTKLDKSRLIRQGLSGTTGAQTKLSITDELMAEDDDIIAQVKLTQVEGPEQVALETLDRMQSLQTSTSASVDSSVFQEVQTTLYKNRLCLKRKKLNVNKESSSTPKRSIPANSQIGTPNLLEFFNAVKTSTPKDELKSLTRQNYTIKDEDVASGVELLHGIAVDTTVCRNEPGTQKISWKLSGVELLDDGQNLTNTLMCRAAKREEQSALVENTNCTRNPGILFKQKFNRNRSKLSDSVKNFLRPKFSIDLASALGYKFLVSNEEITIATEDGAFLVPDDQNAIGVEEVKKAFLSLSSVANHLVSTTWIQHHYKMIILKLHWLDAIFPGSLTPRNACLQLKYRYDYEIDRANASGLRQILECAESSSRRIVLIVLAIYRSESKIEIELSDRWYSIRTCIDKEMEMLIDSGKVEVGTKLMIQSAVLLNCKDGCDPYEVPANVRLKIHTNSTRRARWDTKLGFYQIRNPFPLNLMQVRRKGGLVTKQEFCILRVYPSLFLNDRQKVYRSAKVEQQILSLEQADWHLNVEHAFCEISKKLIDEEEQSVKISTINKKNIRNIQDPMELYQLVQWNNHASEIEDELTLDQHNIVISYIDQVRAERLGKIEKQVRARLENHHNPKSTELLQLRVGDFWNPGVNAVLSIWSPHPELTNLLQECTAIEVTNLVPKDTCWSELQLVSTRKSHYQHMKRTKNKISNLSHIEFFRRVTLIQEVLSSDFKPIFNEFDTCGLIIQIEDDGATYEAQGNNFQSVYIADVDANILCLNFQISVKNYGYESLIQVCQFVVASNLQWRSSSATNSIPTGFVSPVTTFTEKPKNHNMEHALETMKMRFQNDYGENTREFVERCQLQIKEIKSRPRCVPDSSSSLLVGSKTFNASSNLSMNSPASISMNKSTSSTSSLNTFGRVSMYESANKRKSRGEPSNMPSFEIKRKRLGVKCHAKL